MRKTKRCKMTQNSKDFVISWLLCNIELDAIGRISLEDLIQKYTATFDSKFDKNLPKTMKKLFPTMMIKTITTNKKKTFYCGICWRIKPSREINIDNVLANLPKTAMLLSKHEDCIAFGMPGHFTNGNMVMKEVTICQLQKEASNFFSWQLKVSGKTVNIESLGIDSNPIKLTEIDFHNFLQLINSVQLCQGSRVDSPESFLGAKIEYTKTKRNDNEELHFRSNNCDLIVSYQGHKTCRKCQQDLWYYKKSSKKQIQQLENKKSTCKENFHKIHVDENNKMLGKFECIENTSTCQKQLTENIDLNNNENTDPNNNENIDPNNNENIDLNNNKNIEIEQIADEQSNNKAILTLSEPDHNDLSVILEKVFPNAHDKMKLFLKSQHDALSAKSPQARRWDKDVISLCLSLWVRSAKAYNTLLESNMLILPSGRQLRRYKNCIPQEAGLSDKILHWMYQSAKDMKLQPNGWHGGLHHDETRIQQDLIVEMKNGIPTLTGWIDLGEEARDLRIIRDKHVKPQLANEVIQMSFLGFTGFRFPICHYPTAGIKASELNIIIWNVVEKLRDWGFHVDYIMQDGGEENRNFMNMHFHGNPSENEYGSTNLVNPKKKMFHIQDFSHNMKKLRNSILKSGDIKGVHTRKMEVNGNSIVWKQWEMAVEWDRTTNGRKIHHKVTESHLHPNIAEKMRNELAETMLNSDMLHLMKCYRESLNNGSVLDGAIELLEKSSAIISIFRDQRLIASSDDSRLTRVNEILDWFVKWRKEFKDKTDIKEEMKSKLLPSRQCLDDIENMLMTFPAVCKQHLDAFPYGSIKPSRFNNDIVENLFCQQKGIYNGNNSNPTYANFSKSVNSVLLCQSLKSRARKSNAGLEAAQPFSVCTNQPTCVKSNKLKLRSKNKKLKQKPNSDAMDMMKCKFKINVKRKQRSISAKRKCNEQQSPIKLLRI